MTKTKSTQWDKEFVHTSAFKVCKQDLQAVMSDKKELPFLEAMGMDTTMAEFVKENMPLLLAANFAETKTESISILLNNSHSLQHYTVLLMAYSVIMETKNPTK